jgi:Flp pilus assembly protein TadD
MAGHRGRKRGAAAAALAFCLLAGCSSPSPGIRNVDPAVRAQALIDAGNDAYRKGDFKLAANRYGAAAVVRKDDAAAYFGLGMALKKLGRDEEARTAYARARELAQRQREGGEAR